MNLRPYQQECVEQVLAGFSEFQRQLIVVPTGGGKTIIFSELARALQPHRTLILAHREELIIQAVDKMAKATGIFAQVEKAEHQASLSAPVVVASVQTMLRRLAKWPHDHFRLVVADEGHHAVSPSWQGVLNHFQGWKLGVTATPDRSDKRNLGQFFENIPYEVTLLDLIKQGFLCPIKVQAVPLEISLEHVRKTAGDFNDADLGDALAPYLKQIAREIKTHAGNRKTLVFVPLIATSKAFVDHCRGQGINAEHIDGQSPDRAEILKRYARGEFQLLSNAMLLTEGYDEPTVSCVVVLRPTQSRALYSQIVGRGTRTAEGKADLLLLDFLWMHEKHNLIRPAHLIAKSEEDAKEMTAILEQEARGGGFDGEQMSFELEGLESAAKAAREGKLREQLKKASKRKARSVDAMEFCLSLHEVDAADYEPVVAWQGEPLTEKQRALLSNIGIDPETVRCSGQASQIIDIYLTRRQMGLASPKQLHYLRTFGHPSPETATQAEASEFLNTRFGKGRRAA